MVGGEVVTLKSIEESSGLIIAEMPIDVSFDLLYASDICSENKIGIEFYWIFQFVDDVIQNYECQAYHMI